LEPRRSEKAQAREQRARVKATAARVAAEAARVRVNPFVITGRMGPNWTVISEREFTGNAEDPETGMTPRPLDQCRAYMSGAVGLRRIAPA
jgi:carbamate kinase